MSPTPASEHRIVHVARQAILDGGGRVAGYELLYRGGPRDTSCSADGDFAGARLLADAVLDLRLSTITGGRTAFINLTRSLLVNGAATLLRPEVAVFELREDITIDEEVIETCRNLRATGYQLALDDFMPGSPAEALLPFVSFVKVDVLRLTRPVVTTLARRLAPRGFQLIAEKVETREAFDWSREAGCSLFQGYFFCRPENRSGGAVTAHAPHLRLLAALNQPRLTLDELEDLVKQDAALSLRVLQCINSAAFAIRREVHSIREALVLLGMSPIRKWASVWCLAKLDAGGGGELATMALLRARMGELLSDGVPDVDPNEMFIVGLCSLLDAMLGCPMIEATGDLPLSESARGALLGDPNSLRSVLDAVIAYERGDWAQALRTQSDDVSVPRAYVSALAWARELAMVGLSA